jgi:hypothetical protein
VSRRLVPGPLAVNMSVFSLLTKIKGKALGIKPIIIRLSKPNWRLATF